MYPGVDVPADLDQITPGPDHKMLKEMKMIFSWIQLDNSRMDLKPSSVKFNSVSLVNQIIVIR